MNSKSSKNVLVLVSQNSQKCIGRYKMDIADYSRPEIENDDASQYYTLEHYASPARTRYNFVLQADETKEKRFASLQECLEDAEEMMKRKDAHAVLAHTDLDALVYAALSQKSPRLLRGPSVESVFLANHKYYSRRFLDPDPIPFTFLDLSDSANLEQLCEEAVSEVGLPAFFKPCSSTASIGAASIRSTSELIRVARAYVNSSESKKIFVDSTYLNPFYTKHLDLGKYPLATKVGAILEKHMGKSSVGFVAMEGFVFQGNLSHWIMYDSLFWKTHPVCCRGYATPSILPEPTKAAAWKLFDKVVVNMVQYGFDNSFVVVGAFVLEDGGVRLLEVNPRRGAGISSLSKVVFDSSGSMVGAQLKLTENVEPVIPKPSGRHVLFGSITTFGCGKAKCLYDFSCNGVLPGLRPPLHHPDTILDQAGEAGHCLSWVVTSGESRSEILEKHAGVCRKVLLKPELCAWE